jgi:hypothetical protein
MKSSTFISRYATFGQALQGFAVPDGEDKGTKWKTYAALQNISWSSLDARCTQRTFEDLKTRCKALQGVFHCFWCKCQTIAELCSDTT